MTTTTIDRDLLRTQIKATIALLREVARKAIWNIRAGIPSEHILVNVRSLSHEAHANLRSLDVELASYIASKSDGCAGVIDVDGIDCYVIGPQPSDIRALAERLAVEHIECGESEGWLATPDDADLFDGLADSLAELGASVALVDELRAELRAAIGRMAHAKVDIVESAPNWGDDLDDEQIAALDAAYMEEVERILEQTYPDCDVSHELRPGARRIAGNADESAVIAALTRAWEYGCAITDEQLAALVAGEAA